MSAGAAGEIARATKGCHREFNPATDASFLLAVWH
jgi:hypothetical protein